MPDEAPRKLRGQRHRFVIVLNDCELTMLNVLAEINERSVQQEAQYTFLNALERLHGYGFERLMRQKHLRKQREGLKP